MMRIILGFMIVSLAGGAAHADDCVASPVGSNFDVSSAATSQRRDAMAAYNVVDDEYLVVWFDSRNPGQNDVFGQRVSASGTLLGANIAIRVGVGSQTQPYVAHNSTDNEYLVVWKSQEGGPGSPGFNNAYAKRVAGDGTIIGAEFHVSNGGLEGSLVYNATSNQFMHKARNFAGGGPGGIRGQRISNTGTKLGPNITIASAGAPAPAGQLAHDGNANQYLATWRDQVARNLQGQLISASGGLIGGPIVISATFPSSGSAASLAFDPANDRYLVVFGTFTTGEILGQFVSGSGTLIGGNFTIVSGLGGQAVPFIAYSGTDEVYCVVWKVGGDIKGQLLLSDGSLSGGTFTVASATASGHPRMAHNSASGEFLVVWPDNRNAGAGEPDIYAQLIAIDCGCPGDIDGDGDTDPQDLTLLLAAWMSKPGDPNWDPRADLNGDNVVSAADLTILLADWMCGVP